MAQTKLTIANLKTLIQTYADDTLQLIAKGDYEYDRETFSQLIVKIGKMVMLDSDFTDRLPELDVEPLLHGLDIEEYFINLFLPKDHDPTGATALAPDDPTFENAVYTKPWPRKTFTQTVRDNAYKKASLNGDAYSALIANVIKRWTDSRIVYKYGLKRQLLGNAVEHVLAAKTANADLTVVQKLAKPVDEATSVAFVEAIKDRATQLGLFETDTNNLGGVVAKAPSLTLYVRGSDIVPKLDTMLAGAFNKDRAEIPITIKILEDFGTHATDANVYAILMDTRTVGLHSHDLNTESQRNSQGEFTNLFAHETYVGFISKFTNINIFTTTGL